MSIGLKVNDMVPSGMLGTQPVVLPARNAATAAT